MKFSGSKNLWVFILLERSEFSRMALMYSCRSFCLFRMKSLSKNNGNSKASIIWWKHINQFYPNSQPSFSWESSKSVLTPGGCCWEGRSHCNVLMWSRPWRCQKSSLRTSSSQNYMKDMMIITALPDTPECIPAVARLSYWSDKKCPYRVTLNILSRAHNTRNRSETINRTHLRTNCPPSIKQYITRGGVY